MSRKAIYGTFFCGDRRKIFGGDTESGMGKNITNTTVIKT
jgi:hypothetical protein